MFIQDQARDKFYMCEFQTAIGHCAGGVQKDSISFKRMRNYEKC